MTLDDIRNAQSIGQLFEAQTLHDAFELVQKMDLPADTPTVVQFVAACVQIAPCLAYSERKDRMQKLALMKRMVELLIRDYEHFDASDVANLDAPTSSVAH